MVPRATARRFPIEEWEHFLSGYPNSRALLVFNLYGADQYAWAITKDPATTKGEDAQPERASRLTDWVIERLLSVDLNPAAFPMTTLSERRLSDEDKTLRWASSLSKNLEQSSAPSKGSTVGVARFGSTSSHQNSRFNAAAYSSARSVRFIERPDMDLRPQSETKRFAFETTVQNAVIQSWVLSLYANAQLLKNATSRAPGILLRSMRLSGGSDVFAATTFPSWSISNLDFNRACELGSKY